MKNFVILGLLALLLFSVSAALSLWLNQSKQQADTVEKEKEKEKEKALAKEKDKEKDTHGEAKAPAPKVEPPHTGPESAANILREREAKLERRAAQLDLVIRDLQSQREATESTLRQVMNELKNLSTETNRLDALAEDLRKKKVEFEAGEKKNIEKIAAMYDAMTPEAAGPILRQMADSGRLDLAAKILVQMKERNAARVLEAMGDPGLALQIVEKMRGIRAATPPATPAGGPVGTPQAPVVPAKGP